MKVTAIILAAGKGEGMLHSLPKHFIRLEINLSWHIPLMPLKNVLMSIRCLLSHGQVKKNIALKRSLRCMGIRRS